MRQVLSCWQDELDMPRIAARNALAGEERLFLDWIAKAYRPLIRPAGTFSPDGEKERVVGYADEWATR